MLRSPLALLLALSAAHAQVPVIRLINPMNFGALSVDPRGGMIDLTALGVLIPIGPGIQPRGLGPLPARLLLQGKPKAAFSLYLDPPIPILAGPQGARIPMQAFNSLPVSLQGFFNADGSLQVQIGGRLDCGQNLPPGTYATTVRLQMTTPGAKGLPATVSQVFQVKVNLQPNLRLTCLRGLNFGSVAPGPAMGALEVKATGGYLASAAGPTILKGSPNPAVFLVQGQAGSPYSIQLPTRVILQGPEPIVVQELTLGSPNQGIILPGGENRFAVGGKIFIKPDQPAGTYRGSFQVMVVYP
jgi:hypothetical protein